MLLKKIVDAPKNILAIPEKIVQDAVYERTASEAIGYLKRCLGVPLVCEKCGKPAEYTLNRGGRCSEDMPPIIQKGWEVIRVRTIRLDNWGAEGCTLRASQSFLPRGNISHKKVDGKIYRIVERGYFQDIPDEFYRLIAIAKISRKEKISYICSANGEIWTSPEEAPEGEIVPWREVADVTAIYTPND